MERVLRTCPIPVRRSTAVPHLPPWTRQQPRGGASSFIGCWSRQLSECALFRDVTPRDLYPLQALVRVRSIARGGFYFRQGAPPAAIYILTQGAIKLGRVDREGRQVILRMVTPPEPFGYDAVLSGSGSYSAQALTDSHALMWDAATFLRVIADHRTVERNTVRLMASWLRETWERLDDLAARHVAQRVARALLRSIPPGQRRARAQRPVTLALSHQDLGEIVGASLYTVSRVLGEWKRLGIVDVKRNCVVVHRAEDLEAAAEGTLPRGATGVRAG